MNPGRKRVMTDYKVSSYSMEASDFEAIFEGIMRNSKDGLFITDHQGTVVMVNRATEKMVQRHAATP